MRRSRPQDGHSRIDAAASAVDLPHNRNDAAPGNRRNSTRLRKPHERDESSIATAGSKSPAQAEVMRQAHADLERGLQDTDCRGQPVAADSACIAPAKPSVVRAKRAPQRAGIGGASGARTRRGARPRFTRTSQGKAR